MNHPPNQVCFERSQTRKLITDLPDDRHATDKVWARFLLPFPNRSLTTLMLLVLGLACATGCGDPRAKPLVGRWVLEKPDRVMDRIGGDSSEPLNATDSTDDSNSIPRMSITFFSNGTFQTQTAMGNVNREKNGAWQVISLDEAAQEMTISSKIGSEQTDLVVDLVDDSTIRLVPPNMAGLTMKMRFVRDD